MKLAIAALLVTSVAAFSDMSMTFSLGKKKTPSKPPKPVAKAIRAVKKAIPKKGKGGGGSSPSADAWAAGGPSIALPFAKAPASLDGSLLGDVGFDPLGFSTTPVGPYFLDRDNAPSGLTWYREAELIHGRIAQVAVVGFIAPGLFGTLPGNEWTGLDAYSYTNPLEAFSKVPGLALLQIFLFMSFLEFRRLRIIQEEGSNYQAGDLRIGQGEGRWNPFGLNYSPAQYEEKKLQELKHCRLAMVGIFGLWAQALSSGKSVVEQLGAGLTTPDYVAKSGYFFPDGI
jgi:light-harvesting complex I chlorophyll a/b binding protein 1